MPWTTVSDNGRAQRPPPAHLLWCRKVPRLLCHGRPSRIAAALKAHPLRTSYGVGTCHACYVLDDRLG
eukprot:8285883-Pyramimonas_sp.AAC.1